MSILTDSVVTVAVDGVLAAGAAVRNIVMPFDGEIISMSAAVTVAPATTDVDVDVNIAGTTVFALAADQMKVLAAATKSAAAVVPTGVNTFAAGDTISIDLDTVGTTTTGSNLVIVLAIRGN